MFLDETQVVFYWPDGTWCYKEEYSSTTFAFKGDDYGKATFSLSLSEHDISIEIDKLVS